MTAMERARELVESVRARAAGHPLESGEWSDGFPEERAVAAIAAAGLALRDVADAVWAALEDAGLPADSYAHVAALARACDAFDAALGGGA